MMRLLTHPTLTGADTIPVFKFMKAFLYLSLRAIFLYFTLKFNIKNINSVSTLQLKCLRQMKPIESVKPEETHRIADL